MDELENDIFLYLNGDFLLLFFIVNLADLNIYEKNYQNMSKYRKIAMKLMNYTLKILFVHKDII